MGCRVAFIVLTMDSEATVRFSLESALLQEGVEPFFIVVDGGSRDGTLEAVRGILEGRGVEHVVEVYESNIPQARNRGMQIAAEAGGFDYVFFLDSDVVLLARDLVCRLAWASRGEAIVHAPYEFRYYTSRAELEGDARSLLEEARRAVMGRPRVSKLKWPPLGATLIPPSGLGELRLSEDMVCCEDAELGLKAWHRGIPVLEARPPSGSHPAVDLNLGIASDVYRRAPLREYVSSLAYKSLVHEVWSLYEGSITATILRALRRRRRSAYYLASDILAAALLGLGAVRPLLAALGLALPLAEAAARLPREGYSLRRALYNYVKFNLYGAGSLLLMLPAYLKYRGVIEAAYRNYVNYEHGAPGD